MTPTSTSNMKLYFNGCSVTYGDELPDPDKRAWPALVAKALGAEFLNDAVKGGTNYRTWNKTIPNITKFDAFFIQFARASRFTMYDPKNQWEINFNRMLTNENYSNVDYYRTFGKYYYTYWTNPYYEYVNYLNQVISLQNLFEYHNKPYVMIPGNTSIVHPFDWQPRITPYDEFVTAYSSKMNIDQIPDDTLHEMHHNINSLQRMIDVSKFIDQGDYHMAYELSNPVVEEPNDHQNNVFKNHPDEVGHQKIASKVLTYFKSLYNV